MLLILLAEIEMLGSNAIISINMLSMMQEQLKDKLFPVIIVFETKQQSVFSLLMSE